MSFFETRPISGTGCLWPGGLSSHYWRLLDEPILFATLHVDTGPRGVEVMRSLEEVEDWEKLETWMAATWQSPLWLGSVEAIKQVTLKLLLQRPLALPRFEDLCETGPLGMEQKAELRRVCDQVRTERSPLGSPALYVSVCLVQYLSVLIPPLFHFSRPAHTQSLVPLRFARDDTF